MDFVKNFKNLPSKTRNLMSLGLIIALVIALPLFIWAITNLNFNQKERAASGEPVDITLGEPVRGLPSAPVTIVAYTDFQCPFCKSFVDDTFSTILANYPNDVKFVFKDFPLIGIHPLAESAAIAGQCAFNQGMFWEMHDLIFAKQATLQASDFSDFATQLSLDTTLFGICYNNKSTLAEVQDDMTEGSFKGVVGTPTFFINGRKVDGALPYASFKTIIDEELALLVSPTPTSTSLSTTLPTATSTAKAIATATATSGTGGYVEGEPNSCGGTCGSNYNCKANLYCYQGFCRNPICSNESDCDCSTTTSATATPKSTVATAKSGTSTVTNKTATPKSTIKGSPKATPNYTGGMTLIDKPADLTRDDTDTTTEDSAPENMFLTKYAMFIVGGFIIFAVMAIIYAVKQRKNSDVPHITPPTNI
jgi:protein-disulfide isomerase